MKRRLLIIMLIFVSCLAVAGLKFKAEIRRAMFAATLFNGAEQYENFNRIRDIFPTRTMTASPTPYTFPQASPIELPASFNYRSKTMALGQFLRDTDTSALLVVHNGSIVHEQYMLTGGQDVKWLSMSVAKSFIATAIGIAVDEGVIDIQAAMTDYVPALAGSAYEGVRIKDVLQMSSGAAWDENYSDPNSEVNRLGRVLALGGSTTEFVAAMRREFEPGTVNRYNSADTQALGILLAAATGVSITDYITTRLWHPMGMESDAYWMIDSDGVEMAFFGLNATARDYAKLGELFRHNGEWRGKQLVSSDWVSASTKPDAPHVMPGVHEDFPLGYGYQWWVPETKEQEYLAIGVYNQFIYINPTRDLVIVKLSAYSDYATSSEESAYREVETIEFFRAIGRSLATSK